jgi:uncharacterized protein
MGWSVRVMDTIEAIFGDQKALAEQLLAASGNTGDDGSHDLSHLLRVARNAMEIATTEPAADRHILIAAIVLHDCVEVEKNSPLRSQASRLSATRARTILAGLAWDHPKIDRVAHAIEAHSFSANIPPKTLEARIVQDADRLDAIGAIGIARCFYVAGRMGSRLYDPTDPSGTARDLNDAAFALDHFATKLFRIAANFQTKSGQALADARTATMRTFVATMLNEIGEHNG